MQALYLAQVQMSRTDLPHLSVVQRHRHKSLNTDERCAARDHPSSLTGLKMCVCSEWEAMSASQSTSWAMRTEDGIVDAMTR